MVVIFLALAGLVGLAIFLWFGRRAKPEKNAWENTQEQPERIAHKKLGEMDFSACGIECPICGEEKTAFNDGICLRCSNARLPGARRQNDVNQYLCPDCGLTWSVGKNYCCPGCGIQRVYSETG